MISRTGCVTTPSSSPLKPPALRRSHRGVDRPEHQPVRRHRPPGGSWQPQNSPAYPQESGRRLGTGSVRCFAAQSGERRTPRVPIRSATSLVEWNGRRARPFRGAPRCDVDAGALERQSVRTPYADGFRFGDETNILVTMHVLYGESTTERTPELRNRQLAGRVGVRIALEESPTTTLLWIVPDRLIDPLVSARVKSGTVVI